MVLYIRPHLQSCQKATANGEVDVALEAIYAEDCNANSAAKPMELTKPASNPVVKQTKVNAPVASKPVIKLEVTSFPFLAKKAFSFQVGDSIEVKY